MKKVEKFCELANRKFNLSLNPETFRRTYAGYWQRSEGAWSWWMQDVESLNSYGSIWSITELLKNKDKIEIYKPVNFHTEYEFFF